MVLNTITDNNYGHSYDLIDDSLKTLPSDLMSLKWVFKKGNLKKTVNELFDEIDYLLIDADHSSGFATRYIQNIFPKLRGQGIS
jgi:hypothetical protein